MHSGVGFLPGFLDPRALGAEHVERNQQQDNAAGHLKSRDGDAKQFKDHPTRQGEDHQNARHNQTGNEYDRCHANSLLHGRRVSDPREYRNTKSGAVRLRTTASRRVSR